MSGGGSIVDSPVAVRVAPGAGGAPRVVEGLRVEQVRESWLVEDRWWTERPLRRRYWEVVGTDGRNLVVFHELRAGEARGAPGNWFTQRA